MYSSPVEGMLLALNTLKKVLSETILKLNNKVTYQIKVDPHLHGLFVPVNPFFFVAGGNTNPTDSFESMSGPGYDPTPSATYITPVQTTYKAFQTLSLKCKSVQKIMYRNKHLVNNSMGSPWTEFEDLDKIMTRLTAYQSAHPALKFVNEKRGLLEIFQLILSYVVDAKWALIAYHDWITKGFERVFNKNEEYVKWEYETFKTLADSIGDLTGFSFITDITNATGLTKGVKGANMFQKNLINLTGGSPLA